MIKHNKESMNSKTGHLKLQNQRNKMKKSEESLRLIGHYKQITTGIMGVPEVGVGQRD